MNNSLLISFKTLRRLVGWLGIAIGFGVIIGGFIQSSNIQSCISDYYYTNMRDFMVGILCAVGVFLLSYKGYERIDTVINFTTGICAFGIALFGDGFIKGVCGIFCLDGEISKYIHLFFAVSFFLLLAFNSIFLFTKTRIFYYSYETKEKITNPTNRKIIRNKIYIICGIIIFSAISIDAIYMIFFHNWSYYTSLILEIIALIAFGISWLIKGETILADKE
jgi:hypothetical protein